MLNLPPSPPLSFSFFLLAVSNEMEKIFVGKDEEERGRKIPFFASFARGCFDREGEREREREMTSSSACSTVLSFGSSSED